MDPSTTESFKPSQSMEDITIRYSRPEKYYIGRICYRGPPQNTLVTRRHGDFLYFGIAYCNLNLDTFSKKKGRALALKRLYEAESFLEVPTARFFLSLSGTSGFCHVNDIKALLEILKKTRKFKNL